ncbi:hypothetical protein BKA93DRAFT_229278 [Sparassis latifolia]
MNPALSRCRSAAPAGPRRRSEKSGKVAARPNLSVDLGHTSRTEIAWSIVDSPVLGRIEFTSSRSSDVVSQKTVEPSPSPNLKAFSTCIISPLNVKKNRRRGLISGARLVLPPSPLPPATPGRTPQTALTFTAEWDSTEREFFFSPVSEEQPSSSISLKVLFSPVPVDIDAESHGIESTRCTPPDTPYSSADSRSFPSDDIFIEERKESISTAPTSAVDGSRSIHQESPVPPRVPFYMFETEMRRSIAVSESDEAYDKTCFEGLDEDVLLHPWMAFDSLCWGSAIERLRASQQAGGWDTVPCAPVFSKPLPDVPVDPIGSKLLGSRQSRFSRDSCTPPHRVGFPRCFDVCKVFAGAFHFR